MNAMQEALSKANIDFDDLKKNEKSKFDDFPFTFNARKMLSSKEEVVEQEHKWTQGHKSKALALWIEKQDKGIISFLKKNRDRIYLFSAKECQRFCDVWIGYNSKYQQFTLRVNSINQSMKPMGSRKSNRFAGALYNALELSTENQNAVNMLSFTDLLNIIPTDKTEKIIRDTFVSGVIPFERFDFLLEINNLMRDNMITIGSTNINEIITRLNKLEEESSVLSCTKLHKNIIELYCSFNNIKLNDPLGIKDKKNYYNLVFANENDGEDSFFIIL